MRFGFHISIAGGFSRIIERAEIRGCETIQFFSRNPRGWKYAPLDMEEVKRFRTSLRASALSPVFLHLPYLPNIASPKSKFYQPSIDSIATDLERGEPLGAHYLIVHIGHRGDSSEEEAVEAVADGISRALRRVGNSVALLMENTAGQGSEIGYRFEELGKIISHIAEKDRVGVCLDIAHAFEAGYDLSTAEGIERTLEAFERFIGLERLRVLHLNDSKTPLGSRRDRHWHIGEGQIGLEGFRYLVNHSKLQSLPGIMETPRKDTIEDLNNMNTIRTLVNSSG